MLSSNKLASAVAALSLASMSMPSTNSYAVESVPVIQKIGHSVSGVEMKEGHLATCGSTSFSLRKDHVKHYLVAKSGDQVSEVLCHFAPGATFSVSQRPHAPGLTKPAEFFDVTVGDQSFVLLWFGEGSFQKL